MHKIRIFSSSFLLLIASSLFGQPASTPETAKSPEANAPAGDDTASTILVVTGARFSYPLVNKWIDEYVKENPHVQIIIEARGSRDPLKYDILAEVYEPEGDIKEDREYLEVGRYAILPVANRASSFAAIYSDKGLNRDLIQQIFFHNIFQGNDSNPIRKPYTVYTRLQKAGVPSVFSKYYGYGQKDFKGIAIAGSDEHLLKALLRDTTGVTYLPLPLIYDMLTREPVEGLSVLPVDLNGNNKINDEEKFYNTIDRVLETLQSKAAGKLHNIPIEHLHLSVDKDRASNEAIDFLKWVEEHGRDYLQEFGYLKVDANSADNRIVNDLAKTRKK